MNAVVSKIWLTLLSMLHWGQTHGSSYMLSVHLLHSLYTEPTTAPFWYYMFPHSLKMEKHFGAFQRLLLFTALQTETKKFSSFPPRPETYYSKDSLYLLWCSAPYWMNLAHSNCMPIWQTLQFYIQISQTSQMFYCVLLLLVLHHSCWS